MTSIDEAYLPLNHNTLFENKSEDLYLKEIYTAADLPLETLNIEDFDPSILISESLKYKHQMMTYAEKVKTEQKELLENEKKLNNLQNAKYKIENIEDNNKVLSELYSLISEITKKQDEKRKTHIRTLQEYKYLFKIGTHYIQNDPKHLCPICVSEEVDSAIVPCGHTLCSKCSLKCDLTLCYVCRNSIEKVIKLYYI